MIRRGPLARRLNRLLSGRLAMRRPSGYLSQYTLSMFYGAWRATHYFQGRRGAQVSTPMFRVGRRWYPIPKKLMVVFRPFNEYRETRRGERFI